MNKTQERIERIQREIRHLKRALIDAEDGFVAGAYRESIEDYEQEIADILNGDIIVDEDDYQSEMAEIINANRDLEDSQR